MFSKNVVRLGNAKVWQDPKFSPINARVVPHVPKSVRLEPSPVNAKCRMSLTQKNVSNAANVQEPVNSAQLSAFEFY
jgi:hypothetical protein